MKIEIINDTIHHQGGELDEPRQDVAIDEDERYVDDHREALEDDTAEVVVSQGRPHSAHTVRVLVGRFAIPPHLPLEDIDIGVLHGVRKVAYDLVADAEEEAHSQQEDHEQVSDELEKVRVFPLVLKIHYILLRAAVYEQVILVAEAANRRYN